MFNAIDYFINLFKKNKLINDNKFLIARCSDLHNIEPMMEKFQKIEKFVMPMDEVDGAVVGGVPGWFDRRVYTVAIVAKHKWDDMDDRSKQLNICRVVFKQILSKLIVDAEDMQNNGDNLIYMRINDISYREMGPYTMGGATGVIFMLRIDEPCDLILNDKEWSNG